MSWFNKKNNNDAENLKDITTFNPNKNSENSKIQTNNIDKIVKKKKLIVKKNNLNNIKYRMIDNMTINNLNYSKLSESLTLKITKNDKKNNGIFFTPPKTIKENIKYLEPYMKNIKEVLEPSCGSCEYISELQKYKFNITGIELNKIIFESINKLQFNNVKIFNDNYLNYKFQNKFDLIIGNPPYFVMKKKDVNHNYYNYFDGRPNIFILFIIKSLELLNTDGILSFILPKNFLNCVYYDKTRQYIYDNYNILNIIECNDKYIETQQDTIILIIQNKKSGEDNRRFIIKKSSFTIFGIPKNITHLKTLYNNSKTLSDLNFKVCVGNIVWNQCKDDLTDDKDKTLLIYSSDIKDKKLLIKTYSNKEKKNYINKKGSDSPLLVLNRGYGVGTYNFNYCIINENDNIKYLIENHLICIEYKDEISNEDLIEKYKKIIKSFENNKTLDFIKIYFGNNAINTTELCNILPIYDI